MKSEESLKFVYLKGPLFSLENWPEVVKLEGSLLKVFIGPSEKKKKVAYMVKCIRQAWDQAGLQAQALGHQRWRCGAPGREGTRGLRYTAEGWSPSGEELQQKRRKRERKEEDPLASFPEKKQEKAQIHKTSSDRNLKDKTFLTRLWKYWKASVKWTIS